MLAPTPCLLTSNETRKGSFLMLRALIVRAGPAPPLSPLTMSFSVTPPIKGGSSVLPVRAGAVGDIRRLKTSRTMTQAGRRR